MNNKNQSLSQFISYISQAKFTDVHVLTEVLLRAFSDPQSFYDIEIPSYEDESAEMAKILSQKANNYYTDDEDNEKVVINITRDMENREIEENSIAYYRAFGSILADDRWWWYFSTKQFIADIKAAEENPQIIAHFVHVSSGGGEAWLLDKAFEAVQNRKKPLIAFVEKAAASAGYYLIAAADKIYTYTQNDTLGSIGTMVYFLNWMPYFKSLGVEEVEEYATKSTLKNKRFKDLVNGEAKEYIEKELNPLQKQFESAVRSARPAAGELPDDDPVFAGETYTTPEAIEKGLADEMAEIEVAILDVYNRGVDFKEKQNNQNSVINMFN